MGQDRTEEGTVFSYNTRICQCSTENLNERARTRMFFQGRIQKKNTIQNDSKLNNLIPHLDQPNNNVAPFKLNCTSNFLFTAYLQCIKVTQHKMLYKTNGNYEYELHHAINIYNDNVCLNSAQQIC